MDINTSHENQILETMRNHEGLYPLNTRDLEIKFGVSNPVMRKKLKRLQTKGLIHSLHITWNKGFKNYYKLTEEEWPEFIFKKCFKCHNKSTIKTCIFHNLLHELGYTCDLSRVKVKLTKETIACPWFISRGGRRKEMSFEQFLKKSYKKGQGNIQETESSSHDSLLPRYYCLFCSEPLHSLGPGFFPLLGSSVIRCLNCESIYKLAYSEKKEKFVVLYAEEKGHLFRENFEALAGEPLEIEPYSSVKYGIVIPIEGLYHLDFNTETLTVANWVGRVSELDYIVTRSTNDYLELTNQLAKHYPDISIIDGTDTLVSPQPEPHQVGLLRLLRKLKVLNKRFCKATLESRLTVLDLLKDRVSEELRQQAITIVRKQLAKLSRYQFLKIKDWNLIDSLAAKAIWLLMAEIAEKNGFSFPGRCLARNVHCPFKPYSAYYAYSRIDSIINGLFIKVSDNIKEYCSLINFCWDGLPGFCHGITHGGEFGFHLDLIEPFKLLLLPILSKALEDGILPPEELETVYGRRRQKLFSIDPKGQLNDKLKDMIKSAFNQLGKKNKIKTELERYFLEIRNWLANIVRSNYQNQIIHHGQVFNYNVLIDYQIWQFLSDQQQKEIQFKITKQVATMTKPYVLNLAN